MGYEQSSCHYASHWCYAVCEKWRWPKITRLVENSHLKAANVLYFVKRHWAAGGDLQAPEKP